MHQSSATAVRLLAAWQQQRRELTDRLDGLLLHGPTAVDRVAARAEELEQALTAEREAFAAFVDVVRSPGRGTAPGTDPVAAGAPEDVLPERVALSSVPDDVTVDLVAAYAVRVPAAPEGDDYPRLRSVPSDGPACRS